MPGRVLAQMRLPNLVTFGKSVARMVRAHFRREPLLVAEAVFDARLAVCDRCPDLKGRQCQLCTCFVDLKAQLSTENCPASKWP